MTRALIVIPTYNECENILPLAARLRDAVPGAELLIVDDASPDGTGALVDLLAIHDEHVHVLHRPGKEGLGAAYRAGFAWALAADYDAIVQMDADGSHRPEDVPRLLEGLDTADVVLGSRWVDGGSVVNWPLSRELLSRGGSLYARVLLRLGERDITGGFRAFSTGALSLIRPAEVHSQGYSFQVEMLWRATLCGLGVCEVPITFAEREHGLSKMSARIVLEAMARVTLWGIMGAPVQPAPKLRQTLHRHA